MIGDFNRRKRFRRGSPISKPTGPSIQSAWLEFCSVQKAMGAKPASALANSHMKTLFAVGYMPAAIKGYKELIAVCEKLADQVLDLNGPEDEAQLSRQLCAKAEEAGLAIKRMLADYKEITDKAQQHLKDYAAAAEDIQKKCGNPAQN